MKFHPLLRPFLLFAVLAAGAFVWLNTKSTTTPEPVALFATAGETLGAPLVPGSTDDIRAQLDGAPVGGRVTPLARSSFTALGRVARGARVRLPLAGDESVEGLVQLVQQQGDVIRVAGRIEAEQAGTFSLNISPQAVGGFIQFPGRELAYRIEQPTPQEVVLRELRRSEIICSPLPRMQGEPTRVARNSADPKPAVPLLSSRPTAAAVLYLDFDGEVVTDPAWNGGGTIDAEPANVTNAEILEIFNIVKEDFWPFNIDVTTNVARYNGAAVGSRMRCIITPDNTAAPGAGGVAYLNSFDRAGSIFSNTIPCWVFNGSVVGISEAISHEFGHTFGLDHDGRTNPVEEYYEGHGAGLTSWAPIMGVGYYVSLVQWSRGQYLNSSQTEDDVAIISNATNGFGYVADEAGDTRAQTAALGFSSSGVISDQGIITRASDTDYFRFYSTGGSATINAAVAANSPNLDLLLELQDSAGIVLATSNPTGPQNTSLTRNLPAGVYFLRLAGSGEPTPPASGWTTYGSIGAYVLTGSIPGGIGDSPSVGGAPSVSGEVNKPLQYQIVASNFPSSYDLTGALPNGMSLNTNTGLISGTPTQEGTFPITVSATNPLGAGTRNVSIVVTPPRPPNLRTTAPGGWSASIVVATNEGTTTDSGTLDADDMLYVDFAIINDGSLPANITFNNQLFIDDQLHSSYTVTPPMDADEIDQRMDISIGTLSQGNHKITVKVDTGGAVTEDDEGDNQTDKIITVLPPQFPNLTPVQPNGWSDKIVLSSVTGTNTDSPSLNNITPIYADFAINNLGGAAATSAFTTEVYVDGVLRTTITKQPPLNTNIIAATMDVNLGLLTVGMHTIRIKTDAGGSLTELDETDNEYTRSINVVPGIAPNLTGARPAGWSNAIVVSRIVGTHTDSSVMTSADSLYLDFATINNGVATVAQQWRAKVFLDGVEKFDVPFVQALAVGAVGETNDLALGQLPAGNHTLRLVVDATGTVTELDEGAGDNEFSRTITVEDAPAAMDAATFSGLLRPAPDVTSESDKYGLVTVATNSKGSFTAKLTGGGNKLSTKGRLDGTGESFFGKRGVDVAGVFKRKGAAPLILDFRLAGSTGQEELRGELSDGGLAYANFTARRVLYTAKKNPAPPLLNPPADLLGSYTAVFPPKTPAEQNLLASQYAQGHGVGSLTVSKDGSAKMRGVFADGTKFSAAAPITVGNEWPLHATGKDKQSVVNGEVLFRARAGISDFDASDLIWLKPASNRAASYPNGWPQGILVDLLGSAFRRAKGDAALPWIGVPSATGNASVALSGAGLAADLTSAVNIDTKGKVTVVGAAIDRLELKINKKTGAVKGSFRHPVTSKETKLQGTAFDAQSFIKGFFISGQQSGAEVVTPLP